MILDDSVYYVKLSVPLDRTGSLKAGYKEGLPAILSIGIGVGVIFVTKEGYIGLGTFNDETDYSCLLWCVLAVGKGMGLIMAVT